MKPEYDANSELPADPVMVDEWYGLFAGLCEGELSENERDRLGEILRDQPAARRLYLRYIALHSALAVGASAPLGYLDTDTQLATERLALAQLSKADFAGRACGVIAVGRECRQAARWKTVIRWAGSISALLLVAFTAAWMLQSRNNQSPSDMQVTASPTDAGQPDSEPQVLVAEVTHVSRQLTWRTPNSSYALASPVRSGQTLTLEQGQVELTYDSGAKLLLTGPSEFLVRPAGGKLRRGELVARVPKSGHGFTIETPHGKVIDLGTEFGVVVDDFGVSQVSVFEGKVETLPLTTSGKPGDLIELTSGRAIQWTGEAVTPIAIQGRRYSLAAADRPAGRNMAAAKTILDEDFRKQPLSPTRWSAIGNVSSTGDGLRLGTADKGSRPYLLSAQEFDPAEGAINVVCEMRFENARDLEHASFAILTRSSNKQSKPNLPWSDMLARSVSCRLATNRRSGEGMLEAGTKFEADREFTNISWGGFSRPRPNTLYRLEMRDDGLNVTFTISLAANPSVRKTITCRSLFRGNQNFIALEGSNSGATIVERLTISQDSLSADDGSAFASSATTDSSSVTREIDVNALLDELSPEGATLLMQDDFHQDSLQSNYWTTLGSVVLRDGQAQLGLPNDDENIDTWRPRPYLLTKESFDPAAGALTVLGKVTFAGNFLHGYGGSFAVLTRADKTYGGGPTWERSVLRRGVRSNFWPAAFGFDHSLEIHERPTPDSISLLTSAGLNISPRSRSYLFSVTDDGRSASLTLLDASQPHIRQTITHATSERLPTAGHIGFESCWGSPVQLDSVRIYRAKEAVKPALANP